MSLGLALACPPASAVSAQFLIDFDGGDIPVRRFLQGRSRVSAAVPPRSVPFMPTLDGPFEFTPEENDVLISDLEFLKSLLKRIVDPNERKTVRE